MSVATIEPPIEWVAHVTERDLEQELGRHAFARGLDYFRAGHVRNVVAAGDGRTIIAAVKGSQGRSYATCLRLEWPEDPGAISPATGMTWTTECTCPLQVDCKHVVAVFLEMRARLEQAETAPRTGTRGADERSPARRKPAGPPAWEALLTPTVEAVAASSAAPSGTPLALLVSVGKASEPVASRYARGPAGSPRLGRRLQLRPLAPGAKGGWVRTGAGWQELEYAYRHTHRPDHRDAVLAFRRVESTGPYGYFYSGSQMLDADHLGPRLWRLLDDALAAGVAVVSGQKGQFPVRLLPDPVPVVVDLTRSADGIEARPSVTVPGVQGPVTLVGEPPHGLLVETADGLVLARLAETLDPGLARLVADGEPLCIPAEDVDRFLTRFCPALQRRATLGSSDGTVEIPQVRAPRLALDVRFERGHRARLHWCFRYAVGDRSLDVPLVRPERAPAPPMPSGPYSLPSAPGPGPAAGRGGPLTTTGADGIPVLRDAAAEEALLGSLGLLAAVPPLLTDLPGLQRKGVVIDPVVSGFDTIALVRDILPALEARDDVDVTVTGEPVDYVEATEAPVVTVSTYDVVGPGARRVDDEAPDGGIDWFDLGVVVTVAGEEVPLATLLLALAGAEQRLILDSGTWFSLEVPELHALRRILEEARALQDHESDQLRISRVNAGMWEELVALGVVGHQSEAWQRSVGPLLALEELPRPAAPPGLEATLRDYQADGFHWLSLLWDHRLGGVLADDMGLGKTLQTLTMAMRAMQEGTLTPAAPMLIVAPTSVVSTWVREAARFTPELRVATVTATGRRRGVSLADAVAGAHVVVTTYACFRLEDAAYRELPWSGLVLDEAQAVKNHQSQTYRCARRLPAPFKLAITGTPLENSLMDLWALLSIVAPGLFPNPQRFGELYRKPIESGTDPDRLATLRRRVRPLMMRRTKEAVARDLPPKIEQTVSVRLNPQHRRLYDTHLQRERQRILGLLDDVDRNRIAILRALTKLRQLSLDVHLVEPDASPRIRSSKVDALLDQLVEVAAEGHRCLVFSQFTGFLRIVRERLAAEGLDHVYLDGRTRNRPQRIAEFTEGDAPVFVISLKAGGSGLTLTEADYVFVLDPWWNPAVENQAIDRAHRIGQDKTVMVYRLVSEGTVEEKVVELQERKRDLFARVVDDGGLMAAPLTADDIRGLLGA